jgi:hypothetical protein
MPTTQELLQNGIRDWDSIKANYPTPNLLLGNGFTLQFSLNFSYQSLFRIFLDTRTELYQRLFSSFGTTNFEMIQSHLLSGRKINEVFGLSVTEIDEAINQLKLGLIQAINAIHPRVVDVDFNQLKAIAKQLHEFGDIYTTNYDLYLYHIIMQTNDIANLRPPNPEYIHGYTGYQDYFWGYWAPLGFKQFMGRQKEHYKNIYYLHGSLVLFKNAVDHLKLVKTENELIDEVSNQIQSGSFPIFVTEGDFRMKVESIRRDSYLSFCFDKLEYSQGPTLIFGNTLGDIDNHILQALKKRPKQIIYSIYVGNRTMDEILAEKHSFLSKFNGYRYEPIFVDSRTVFNL